MKKTSGRGRSGSGAANHHDAAAERRVDSGKRPLTARLGAPAAKDAAPRSSGPGVLPGPGAGPDASPSRPGSATGQAPAWQSAWDSIFQWSDAAGPGVAPAGAGVVQATSADTADQVHLSVSWSGKFGGDLSARVVVKGTDENGKNPTWHELESEDVADPDSEEGEPAQRVSTKIRADRYKRYQVTVEPTATAPHDRYSETRSVVNVGASAQTSSVRLNLNVNRWNVNNVHDVWDQHGVDRDKAGDVVSARLCGRSIRVNRLVMPRVARTNELFGALPEETQQEIRESIAIMGGYALRTTSKGTYSNHSIGCAVDINYNMNTRQNFHFERRNSEHIEHLRWVEAVIHTDPAFRYFDILDAQGQEQLEAALAFNRRFPLYLAELLDLNVPQLTLEGLRNDPPGELATLIQGLLDYGVGGIVDTVTVADLDKAIKGTSDAAKKTQLAKVRQYWPYTRAWLRGSTVTDRPERRQKKLVGMIPLHEQLLRIFLDAGWSWGGDWEREKDYMHFEDKAAREIVEGKAEG